MNRTERRAIERMKLKPLPQPKRPQKLSEPEVIKWLASPRAALDRMIANGRIEEYDIGALQCLTIIVEKIGQRTNIPCPDSRHIRGLMDQIVAGMEVIEERIERARSFVEAAASVLRKVDRATLKSITDDICLRVHLTPGRVWNADSGKAA